MDYARARLNMVESQLRPNEVTDRDLLDAMSSIPRERFVPQPRRGLAYMDGDLRLAVAENGQSTRFLLAPRTLARLIQLAEIGPGDAVLDVGCATGYSSAVMSRLAQAVVGLECDERLARQAAEILDELDADNVVVVTGPLEQGYESAGPYDAIVLNGEIPHAPQDLIEQLREGGRLVAMLSGRDGSGRAQCFMKLKFGIGQSPAFDGGALALPGFERTQSFIF